MLLSISISCKYSTSLLREKLSVSLNMVAKLGLLKYFRRDVVYFRHSTSICFTVSCTLHLSQMGGSAPLTIRYEWVRLVCPILNLVRAVSILRLLLLEELQYPISGFTSFSLLLWYSADDHFLCHSSLAAAFTIPVISVCGIALIRLSISTLLEADLALVSALSFPAILQWPGTQQRFMCETDM